MNDKVILDTNVVISAAISGLGNPAKIIELVSDGIINLYYSNGILAEYEEVLSREKFGFSPDKQKETIDLISKNGILINPAMSNIEFHDKDDTIFYDAAKFVNAVLITGNTRHYPDDKLIMTPAEYLESLSDLKLL